MSTNKHLKINNFSIKPDSLEFRDTEFMSASTKMKIYKQFISFINNHFKDTCFKKDLYEHLHSHCGFIAHYNINGFYAAYFAKAAIFHKVAYDHKIVNSEYMGIFDSKYPFKGKNSIEAKDALYEIKKEIDLASEGIGEFTSTILNNMNYGGYAVYTDLDMAIKNALNEYITLFTNEVKLSIKVLSKEIENNKESVAVIKKSIKPKKVEERILVAPIINGSTKQVSLFDFL